MVEATEEAKKMGAPKAFNVIVLGAAAKHMGFEKEDWLKVIETTVPPKTVEINKKAFETGQVRMNGMWLSGGGCVDCMKAAACLARHP